MHFRCKIIILYGSIKFLARHWHFHNKKEKEKEKEKEEEEEDMWYISF